MSTPLDIVNLYHPIGNLCIIKLTGVPSDLEAPLSENDYNLLSFHPAERFGGTWTQVQLFWINGNFGEEFYYLTSQIFLFYLNIETAQNNNDYYCIFRRNE